MKRLVVALTLLSSGCALEPWRAPQRQPLQWLENQCSYIDVLDEHGQRVANLVKVDCPALPAYTDAEYGWVTSRKAAGLGVLLRRETICATRPPQTAGRWSMTAYLSAGSPDPILEGLVSQPRMNSFTAAQVFRPNEYALLRARSVELREDLTYGKCQALVLDIPASTEHPEQAQACTRAMEAIDRSRSMRQSRADHAEMVAVERSRADTERERADIERGQANAQRLDRLADALRAMGPAPMPPLAPLRRSVTTNCTTFGSSTNCTTR